ncbi:MAG: DNA-nicking Smr family endonuclease [Woeseiaceae bacterium]|jgi:DNA-nicking Smr family endonuclease
MPDHDDNNGEDEADLFRRQMAGITPLRNDEKMPLPKPKVRPKARFAREDEREVLRESMQADIDEIETSSGEHLRFYRASVGKRTLRKLARGNFSVQNEIDLHGMIIPEAKTALREFIEDSRLRGYTCVRVIHGKGLGSGERGPVLKRKVNHWLQQWDEILAFASARQVDGGTGAVQILLRKD